MSADAPIRPTFHHFNLKTTRLQELIDWYATVVGAEVTFQDATGAWLTNDVANHRIALLCFPGFVDDPERETRTGMHHSAFEYDSFTDLNSSYLRLRDAGIEPDVCIDHGMTLSYYYKDPDGNRVERLLNGELQGRFLRDGDTVEVEIDGLGTLVDPVRSERAPP
jgi:catechol 2,3-dioxygenase